VEPIVKTSHLFPAFLAATLLVLALVAGNAYAASVEQGYVRALTPIKSTKLKTDSVLQQAVLQQPNLLLLYGSSEVTTGGLFNGRVLFRNHSTGFDVYEAGAPSADAIIILQEVAALGPALRGKKIVISLSPEFFLNTQTPDGPYESNFSLLDANELAFSAGLDLSLKQAAARRMLEYPRTLRHDPLLEFALQNLAADTPLSRAFYMAALPLGKLHLLTLQLQNHWDALSFIAKHPHRNPPDFHPTALLDWARLAVKAIRQSTGFPNNDPFGITDWMWQDYGNKWLQEKNDLSDRTFYKELIRSKEWSDLDLLLKALHEWGAQPLVISLPLDGLYYDYRGVSASARATYYAKLRAVGTRYGVPVVAFQDHEYDKFFFLDVAHPSMKGWLYYDQAMDAFFHGTLH
jgi:D-alanine transfer protein